MPSNNPKSKYVTPRSVGMDRFDHMGGDPEIWDGVTPRNARELRAQTREIKKSGVRTQSSLDSLSSLMQLIKKLPNEKQKSIIEQLKAARKKPGGSPDATIEDLPF